MFEDIHWPPTKKLLYFAHPSHVEKLIHLFKPFPDALVCIFRVTVRLWEVFFCWDLRIGVCVCLMGGVRL